MENNGSAVTDDSWSKPGDHNRFNPAAEQTVPDPFPTAAVQGEVEHSAARRVQSPPLHPGPDAERLPKRRSCRLPDSRQGDEGSRIRDDCRGHEAAPASSSNSSAG